MSGATVVTTRNVHTGRVMDLCMRHYASEANGDAQVQHGLHFSLAGCAACSTRGHFQPSAYKAGTSDERCAGCGAPFGSHYNGQCPPEE